MDLGFSGKVQDLLSLLQGRWGAYGSSVQWFVLIYFEFEYETQALK
jgi:hypothetical protein